MQINGYYFLHICKIKISILQWPSNGSRSDHRYPEPSAPSIFVSSLFTYSFLFFNILFSFIYIIHIIHVQNITATRHWLFTSHHKICTLRLTFYHNCTYHNSLFTAKYICAWFTICWYLCHLQLNNSLFKTLFSSMILL